jgi:hypothetical protein
MEYTRIREFAQHRGFHAHLAGQVHERFNLFRIDGQ